MTIMDASATRSQYWWPQIINYLILFAYAVLTGTFSYIEVDPQNEIFRVSWSLTTIVFFVLSVFVWLANFTVRARRLHDRDHSNWWILFYIVPGIGNLIILITLILPSKEQTRWPINQSDS